MGFMPTVRIRKVRRSATFGELTVCLDELDGVGVFVEVERQVPDGAPGEAVQAELSCFVESLGIRVERCLASATCRRCLWPRAAQIHKRICASTDRCFRAQEGHSMSMTLGQGDDGVTGSRQGSIDIAASVAEFHRAFNLPMRQLPSADIDHALATLRVALLEEEVSEFITASAKRDFVGIADALADIVHVIYGTALTYGIDLDSVLREVHRSNMSKLASDGSQLVRDDGKVLKSDRYFPPDIASVLSLGSS